MPTAYFYIELKVKLDHPGVFEKWLKTLEKLQKNRHVRWINLETRTWLDYEGDEDQERDQENKEPDESDMEALEE